MARLADTPHQLTFPMAGDPKREVYGLYAEACIPRTVLIDAESRIVRQAIGYDEEEFKALLKSVDDELAKLKSRASLARIDVLHLCHLRGDA